ncbi:MAG: Peptidoglycan/xylan/chitin deacetylase, PgdA/CDA1 family [Verrucomicrobia bacterium]|nr:MAG: Peptidoglycan/xylan/chitin deacetylase, PgdA/CDA1 family [Verrucomicrobiota bacterium]
MKLRILSFAAVALGFPALVSGQAVDPDTKGVLLQSIPDRLVVLTFDDAPASHATVVAPILKSLGFGGSIYVSNFDSFKTRKDWYLTYRQMNAMHADGLEIGNHTYGHGGGLENYLRMEDEVMANGGPNMTTVCWPIYHVMWPIVPRLLQYRYLFGRGGHERPYRPTVDHPFDVPSFSMTDGTSSENFVKAVQQACRGRVVVLTFHGVPDMEHPPVSLEPATFRAMMQYLKDNHYQCIAMRDLAKYINVSKAVDLPLTVDELKDAPPFERLKDEIPFVAPPTADIREFRFPDLAPARITKGEITVTVPFATDVAALAPKITVSNEATVAPASGTVRDFSKPQTYTVTARDGAVKPYVVAVKKTPVSHAADILTFTVPGARAIAVSQHRIAVSVPKGTDVKALTPAFTLSPFATAEPASGASRDFTKPQTYKITAEDGSSRVITVAIVKTDKASAFEWMKAGDGNWSDASRWTDSAAAPLKSGSPDCILTFDQSGKCTATNDLGAGFLLNQLVLGERSGGLTLSGDAVNFTKEPTNQIPPTIRATKCGIVNINVPVTLQHDLTVVASPDKDPNCFITFNEVISGPHALILQSSGDPNVAGINFHDVHFGVVEITNSNTYSGGTLINGGKINVRKSDGLGTGPVTIDNFGTLSTEQELANPVAINEGTLFHCNLSGPIKLDGNAGLIGNCTITGSMSGPGGFTMFGTNGTYLSMIPGGTVTLSGANSYSGPTNIFPGTLVVKTASSLYNADASKWTAANITIQKAATLRLNVGGPGEFTGEQVGTLLGNLTHTVNDNGMMGGSFLCLDTANATEPVTIAANLGDSQGPGGGAFLLKKCGTGTMRLPGNNTYTGQTILESGRLSVASLNSFSPANRKPGSSLGAPMDIESGEIVIGEEGKDGDCALIYTGTGESTDRVINLAGRNDTVTFDQSGTGPLKFTSPILISGYGADKTIALKGDTAGNGELAGNLTDPHDRTGKARTSLTKSGNGTWILSGANTFTGPTKLTQGTLAITNAQGLNAETEVDITEGATLQLDFKGEMRIGKLSIGGKPQPPGTYDAKSAPQFIKGSGVLKF